MSPQTSHIVLAAILMAVSAPAGAEPFPADPTRADCLAAVEQARQLEQSLPTGNLSRYFAERELDQALAESGNGENDDCLELADKATEEVIHPHHELKPGETLTIRRAGKIETDPALPASQIKSAD